MQWKRHEVPCDRNVKGKRGRIWARLGKKSKMWGLMWRHCSWWWQTGRVQGENWAWKPSEWVHYLACKRKKTTQRSKKRSKWDKRHGRFNNLRHMIQVFESQFSLHFQTSQFPKFILSLSFFPYPSCCLLPFLQGQKMQKAQASYLLPVLFIIQGISFLFVHSLQVTGQTWLPGHWQI